MEARKIIVFQTKTQRKSVIMSAATTLRELKRDLSANNIDYSGMTFYEGTSKIELKTDDSVLPHDVPYKGQITNELVFMLTNTNKKVKSGVDRAWLFSEIKRLGLQKACLEKFGKNFTQCKSPDLNDLIEEACQKKAAAPVEAKPKETPVEVPDAAEETKKENTKPCQCVDVKAREALRQLLSILADDGVIYQSMAEEIYAIMDGNEDVESSTPKSTLSYSKDELDEMFDFCK